MMRKSMNKKGWTLGIIVLFFCGAIIPGISSKTNNIAVDNTGIDESLDSVDFATLTFYTLDENGKKQNRIDLPLDKAKDIFNLFNVLKNMTIYEPKSLETEVLKNDFIGLLDENSLIPNDLSKQNIQSLINPHGNSDNPIIKSKTPFLGFIFEMLSRNRFNLFRFSEILPTHSDWNIFCNIGSAGVGVPVPIIMIPRPRAIAMWLASYAETAIGSLVIPKSFLAEGSQQGLALGFTGVGLTIAFGGITAYGILGYAMYTSVQAESFYRTNIAPMVSNENPSNGADFVPIGLSELSFRISDGDGDLMDYTVTTSPNIGSKSEYSKGNGVIHVPVSGLVSDTDYSWYVTVDDGYDTVERHFTFKTEAVAPDVSDPNPSDGAKDVPISLSQLSFKLKDYQGDLMDYTVETTPDIGSGSGNDVGDGTYTMNVGSLEYFRWYTWYVNVTDGTHWTRAVFDFRTEMKMVLDPFDEGWQYRKMITIDHNMVNGNLVDFPVLISTVDSDLKNKAQNDGDDILFMDGSGVATRLVHEIESYDGSTGRLIAWVNVNSLSSSVDTVLYMYYGNSGCSSQEYPERVWDSNYVAVWHMDGSSYTSIKDSTMNNLDATGDYGNPAYHQSGQIGYSVDFDGDDKIMISDDDKFSFTNGNNDRPLTIESWVNYDISDNNPIISKWDGPGDTGAEWLFRLRSVDHVNLYLFDPPWDANERASAGTIPINTWTYVVGKYDGSEYYNGIDMFLDGSKDLGDGHTGPLYENMKNDDHIVQIACYDNWYFYGKIDEIRISDIERSDTWISTSFNTMNDPSSFFTIGPEEI